MTNINLVQKQHHTLEQDHHLYDSELEFNKFLNSHSEIPIILKYLEKL